MSYIDDRADAAQVFGEDGMVLTLTYPATSPTYNVATATVSGTTHDPETVAGAIFPLTPFRMKGNIDIVEGDQQLYLSALNTAGTPIAEPLVGGTITNAAARKWSIIAVDPLSPASIDIFYDCIVRRAQ